MTNETARSGKPTWSYRLLNCTTVAVIAAAIAVWYGIWARMAESEPNFAAAVMQTVPKIERVPVRFAVTYETTSGHKTFRLVEVKDYSVYYETGICVKYHLWPLYGKEYNTCVPLHSMEFDEGLQ